MSQDDTLEARSSLVSISTLLHDMGVKEINIKNYEWVSPDGGWGYMIAIAVTINLFTITSFLASFGMIYKDLFIELDMDSTDIASLNGMSAFCIAISGFIATPFLKILSMRKLGFIAAIIFNLGVLGTVFVKSKLTFFICLGFCQSVGNGIIYNLSCTILNDYFVKRRLLAVSITQTLIGAGGLVVPQFVKWSLDVYGVRGTLLLISGVSLQNIFATAVMQPVKWHMKKVEVLVPEDKENESKSLLLAEEKVLTSKDYVKTPDKSANIETNTNTTNEKLDLGEKKNEHKQENNNCIVSVISKVIDVSIFKTFFFSNAAVGMSLCLSAEYTFIIMLPQALYSMQWTEGDVAWALSLNAMGDLLTRILFMLTSTWLFKIGSHKIYVFGLSLAFLTKLGMLCTDSMTVMTGIISSMGLPRCIILLLVPVVVADAVDQDQFGSAIGLVQLLFGVYILVFGPVIGVIRDLTDSYSTAFYILSSCFGIITIFWTIELIYKKNKHKRALREVAEKV